MIPSIKIYACPNCLSRWQGRRVRRGGKLAQRRPKVCPHCGGRKIDGPLTVPAVRP